MYYIMLWEKDLDQCQVVLFWEGPLQLTIYVYYVVESLVDCSLRSIFLNGVR